MKNFILIFLFFNAQIIYALDVELKLINSSNNSICVGSTETIKAHITNFTGVVSYDWTPSYPSPFTVVNDSSISINLTTPGTYTYICNVINGGNTASDTIAIIVNPLPTVPDFSFTNNLCADSVTFTTCTPASSYSWNFGDGSPVQHGQQITHHFISSNAIGNGTYIFNVTLTITDINGCSNQKTLPCSVKQIPDASIAHYSNDPFTFCNNNNEFLLEVSNISSTIITNTHYSINWADGTPLFENNTFTDTSHTYLGFGYFPLLFTVTGSNGCEAKKTYTVFNGSNPSVPYSNPGNTTGHCIPWTISIPRIPDSLFNNPPGTFYVVSYNDGSPNDTFSHPPPYIHHTFTSSSCGATGGDDDNTYYVQIEAINNCGNSSITIEPITIAAKPKASFSVEPDTIVCINEVVVFENSSMVGEYVSYTNNSFVCMYENPINWFITPNIPNVGWVVQPGSSLGSSNPSTAYPNTWGTETLEVKFIQKGEYTVWLVVRNNECGNDTMHLKICVQTPVVPPIFSISSDTICKDDVIILTNYSNPNPNLDCYGPDFYWSCGLSMALCDTSNWQFTGGTTSTDITSSILFKTTGIYAISLTESNACGIHVLSKNVTVQGPPKVIMSVVPDTCAGLKVLPSATINNCGSSQLSCNWTFNNGGTITNSSLCTPDSVFFNGANNSISIAVSSECGITDESISFNITPTPTALATVSRNNICADTITLYGKEINGNPDYKYEWSSIPQGFSSTEQNPVASPSVTTTYILAVYDSSGTINCAGWDSVTLNVIPSPTVNVIPANVSLCQNEAVQLTASGADTYSWSPGTCLNISMGETVIASPANSINITVTGTDTITGCPGSAISQITVNPLPQIGSDTMFICTSYMPITLGGATGTTWSGSSYISSSGFFHICPTGEYLLYLTDNITLCYDSVVVYVEDPELANAGPDFEICINNGPYSLNNVTPGYGNWIGNGIVNNNAFDPLIAGVGTHILTYGNTTCVTTDTVIATVLAAPIVTVNNPTICSGDDVTLTAFANETVNYAWSVSLSDTNEIIVSPSSTTVIYLTVTSTNTGCSSETSATVTVEPRPDASFTYDSIACADSIVYFYAASNPAGTQYEWYINDVLQANTQNFTYTFPTAGLYNVKLLALLGICSDSIKSTIEIITAPVSDFVISLYPSNGCGPLTVSLDNTSTGDYINYLWDFGNSTTSTDTMPQDVVYPACIDTIMVYSISLTTSNLCASIIKTDTIAVYPSPHANFGMSKNAACSDELIRFYANVSGFHDSLSWNFGNHLFDTIVYSFNDSLFFGFPNPGTTPIIYSIEVIAYNQCGSDTLIKMVTIYPDTIVSFFTPNYFEVCVGDSIKFYNNSTNGCYNYYWNFGDGCTDTVFEPKHTYDSAGFYNVTLLAIHPCASALNTVQVRVNPLPKTKFSTQGTYCENTQVLFNNLTPSPNTTNGITDSIVYCHWDFGFNASGSTQCNSSFTYYMHGNYEVTLTTINNYGCSKSYFDTITIDYIPFALFTDSVYPPNLCNPVMAFFSNNTSPQNNNLYQWDLGNGSTWSGVIPPAQQYENNSNFNDTVFFISLEAVNMLNANCKSTFTDSIIVHPLPKSEFVTSDSALCSFELPANIQFVNLSEGATAVEWYVDSSSYSNILNPSITLDTPGKYSIALVVNNQYGCTDVSEQDFRVYPPWENTLEFYPTAGCQPLDVRLRGTNDSISYYWYFGDGTSYTQPSGKSLNHSYINAGSYSLKIIATGISGCTDTLVYNDTITLKPRPIADFETSDTYNPSDGTINFINNTQYANDYLWYFGDGHTSIEESPEHRYFDIGNFDVMLIANNMVTHNYDSYVCSDTIIKNIDVSFSGLFIPNAFAPGHTDFLVSVFKPIGVGLVKYECSVWDTFGNMLWVSNLLDENGSPVEFWDGISNGSMLPMDIYVWKASAIFKNGSTWKGMPYKDNYIKSGIITLIRNY